MRKVLPTVTLMMLLAGSSVAFAQVSIGVRIGEPPAPRAYKVPPRPAPNYEWVEGYWQPQGSKYQWHDGHWAKPPHTGAYWQQPYYSEGRYYKGSWQGGDTEKGHEQRGRQTGTSGHDGR